MVVIMTNEIFIYPVDTVWGIGGNAFNEQTYLEIAKIKRSANNKPLSILFSSIEQLLEYAQVPDSLLTILEENYQKEVSFGIAKKFFKRELPALCFSSTDFVSVRIISNDMITKLIEQADGPITTTSLNLSGEAAITEDVQAKDFWKKHASDCLFVQGQYETQLSGHSSSIIILSGNEYRVLRSGRLIKEIEQNLLRTLTKHE